jgi:hypothetical protein
MTKGIDIAWARPDVDGIKATGAKWVARYFSNDTTKNITKEEIRAYVASGLSVVTVWESTAGAALKGRAQGIKDAQAAEVERANVGLPADHVIYFAVDQDTTWAKVADYFEGVASVLGKWHVGIYGGYKVVLGANKAGYGYLWQTLAWSNGLWVPEADIRQVGGTVLKGSADVDTSESLDFGQYPAPITPVQEDDMQLTDLVTLGTWEKAEWPSDASLKDGKLQVNGVLGGAYGHARAAHDGVDTLKAEVAALTKAVAALTVLVTPAKK